MIYQKRSKFSCGDSFTLAAMIVLLAFFCGNGCGGGSAKNAPPPEPAAETPAVKDAEAEKEKQAEKKPPKKKKKKSKSEDTEETAAEKPLPEDMTEWTREDFLRAKALKKEDPKYDFTPALAVLGSRNYGTDAAEEDAEILLALLAMELPPDFDAEIAAAEAKKAEEAEAAKNKPAKKKRKKTEDEEDGEEDAPEDEEEEDAPEPEEEPEEEVKPERLPPLEIMLVVLSPAEVKAGVAALLENDSPAAKQGILDVFSRKVRTDSDRDAVQAALEGISDAGTPDSEKLLFRMLTYAESFRQPQDEDEKAALNVRLQGGKTRKAVDGRQVNIRTVGGSRNLSDITAQEMRTFVMNRMRDRFSSAFREEIALFLMNPQVDAALLREQNYQRFLESMLQYVMEKKPENLEAQLALYLQPALAAEQKLKLEENLLPLLADVMRAEFLLVPEGTAALAVEMRREKESAGEDEAPENGSAGEASADAGWSLLGGAKKTETSPRGGSGGVKKTDGPAFAAQLLADDGLKADYARQLWSDALIKMELARLPDEFKKLMKQSAGDVKMTAADFRDGKKSSRALEMLMLTPRSVPRKAVSRILTRGWDLGPAVMTQAGVLGVSEKEPGFLMILKSLERRDPPKTKAGSGSSRGGTEKKLPASLQKKEDQAKTAGEWMKTAETQVKHWCDQFAQAGLSQMTLADTDAGVPADFPSPLPEDMEIVAKYVLDHRPGGVSRAGEGLKIHFVRFTYTARWSQAVSFFRRAHKGLAQRETDTSENPRAAAVWMERYRMDDETKVCQSLDVRLSPVGGGTIDLKSATPAEIQVDILVMEMDDLRDAGEKKAAETPAEAPAEETSPEE